MVCDCEKRRLLSLTFFQFPCKLWRKWHWNSKELTSQRVRGFKDSRVYTIVWQYQKYQAVSESLKLWLCDTFSMYSLPLDLIPYYCIWFIHHFCVFSVSRHIPWHLLPRRPLPLGWLYQWASGRHRSVSPLKPHREYFSLIFLIISVCRCHPYRTHIQFTLFFWTRCWELFYLLLRSCCQQSW